MEAYDTIGGRYDQWNLCPAGQAQQAMVERQLGDLTGRSVLDVGCGTGYYCRALAAHNARRVLGVDSCQEMIRQAESNPPHEAIEYRYGDAITGLPSERFDLVTAVWIVNQADNHSQLDAMTAGFARRARELLLVTTNTDADWALLGAPARRYGVDLRRNGPAVDGRTPHVCTVVHGGEEFSFQSASWTWDVLTDSLRKAGYDAVWRIAPDIDAPADLTACLPFMVLRAVTSDDSPKG